jgi:DNA topoisomerase-1
METVSKNDLAEKTDEKCPNCGKDLMIKLGRYGKFLACSGFPECKYTRPLGKEGKPAEPQKTDEKCPKCGKDLVLKESRFGKFLACSGYPGCKYTKNIVIESKVKCPDCGGKLIQKRTRKGRTFWGCENYPKCKRAYWKEPK